MCVAYTQADQAPPPPSPTHLCAEGQWNWAADGGEDDVQIQAVHGVVHGLEVGPVDCEPEGGLVVTEGTGVRTGEEVPQLNNKPAAEPYVIPYILLPW